jgi:hypothetical protein
MRAVSRKLAPTPRTGSLTAHVKAQAHHFQRRRRPPRGALLGKVTATGEYRLSRCGANDGSQVPDAILLEPVDATAADVEAAIAIAGEFNPGRHLRRGPHGRRAEAVLRTKDIYFRNVIG